MYRYIYVFLYIYVYIYLCMSAYLLGLLVEYFPSERCTWGVRPPFLGGFCRSVYMYVYVYIMYIYVYMSISLQEYSNKQIYAARGRGGWLWPFFCLSMLQANGGGRDVWCGVCTARAL